MDKIIIIVAIGIVNFIFPIIAAVIALRRGRPGWCFATIMSIPIGLGWLIAIFALLQRAKMRLPTVASPPSLGISDKQPLPRLKDTKIKQNGNKPHSDLTMRILAVVGYLFPLALFIWLAHLSIENMAEDIATRNAIGLVVRAIASLLFLSFLLVLLLWPLPFFKHRPHNRKILISFGLVTLFFSISIIVLNGSVRRLPEFDEKFWSTMRNACNGIGSEEATTYNPGVGIHKVVSITQDLYFMPYEWLPDSLAETELVLCVGEQVSILIQTCHYSPYGEFTRYQKQMSVSLVAVRSGKVTAQNTFSGSPPASCPFQISQSGSTTGNDVKDTDLLDWMKVTIEQ